MPKKENTKLEADGQPVGFSVFILSGRLGMHTLIVQWRVGAGRWALEYKSEVMKGWLESLR